MAQDLLNALRHVLPSDAVFTDEEHREAYGHDETEDLKHPPDVVVRPRTTEEVAAVLRICHALDVPVTPIGGRTGLSGGALCVQGGVGLALDDYVALHQATGVVPTPVAAKSTMKSARKRKKYCSGVAEP
mgnify:CR=1 FL=1